MATFPLSSFGALGATDELRTLADSLPGSLCVVDHDLRFLLVGEAHVAQTAFRPEAEGRTLAEVLPPETFALVEPHYRLALSGTRTSFDTPLDGAVYRMEISPIRRDGEIVGAVSVATDVTARVEADRPAQELNAELETILTQAPIGLALVRLDGSWLRVNDRVCEIVGYTRDELLTRTFQEITHPDDLAGDLQNVRALLAGDIASYTMEKRYFHKNGQIIWIWLSVGLIRDEFGDPLHFVTQIEDITGRKRAESYLAAERAVADALAHVPSVAEAWARVLEAIGSAMDWEQGEAWLVDESGDELVCAGMWSAEPSLAEFSEVTWLQSFRRGEGLPGQVWERNAPVWSAEAPSEPFFVRNEAAREVGLRTGVGLPLVSEGRTIGTIGFFSRRAQQADPEVLDLMSRLGRQLGEFFARRRSEEERQAMERRLLASQKRESLGVLAGGIAHDFNNLLVGVLGNASLLLEDLPDGSPQRELAQQIELAATRAADLTRQMLAYSGQGRFVVEPIDVSTAAAEMVQLMRSALSKRARIELELAESLPPVEADCSQIRQVLMNLLTNAAEAIGDAGGTVRVRTSAVDADRALLEEFRFGEDLPEGRYVLVEVEDDGCGMTEHVVDRIFEPYFTTKFTGRGLGLAASLGIVRGHRAALRVQSTPGHDTAFGILLPAAAASRHVPEAAAESAPKAPQASGTVLVADDEAVVRELVTRALSAAGYAVLPAADGSEALALLERHRDEIVCVLLDLTMPGRSGEEVLTSLERTDPTLPVVISSGYSRQALPASMQENSRVLFLQKPYAIAGLLEAVGTASAA